MPAKRKSDATTISKKKQKPTFDLHSWNGAWTWWIDEASNERLKAQSRFLIESDRNAMKASHKRYKTEEIWQRSCIHIQTHSSVDFMSMVQTQFDEQTKAKSESSKQARDTNRPATLQRARFRRVWKEVMRWHEANAAKPTPGVILPVMSFHGGFTDDGGGNYGPSMEIDIPDWDEDKSCMHVPVRLQFKPVTANGADQIHLFAEIKNAKWSGIHAQKLSVDDTSVLTPYQFICASTLPKTDSKYTFPVDEKGVACDYTVNSVVSPETPSLETASDLSYAMCMRSPRVHFSDLFVFTFLIGGYWNPAAKFQFNFWDGYRDSCVIPRIRSAVGHVSCVPVAVLVELVMEYLNVDDVDDFIGHLSDFSE